MASSSTAERNPVKILVVGSNPTLPAMLITWKHLIIYAVVAVSGFVGGSALFLGTYKESGDFDMGPILGPIAIGIFFLGWPIFLPIALVCLFVHALTSIYEKIRYNDQS